ncbi:hypothetical protein WJX79_001388 [Trebouxia sp. C0005]
MRCTGGNAAPGASTNAVGGHWRALTAFRARLPATMTRATCKMHRVICIASPGPGLVAAFAAQEESPGYRKRLEYVASLTALETGVSLTVSVLSCTVYYLAKAPTHFSLRFALSVALLFAASLTVCRTLLLERKHQDRLMAEQELKDHDSVFTELHGTAVHYKLAQGLDTAHPTAVHCYHGFGANTFSWSYVYKALSTQLRAQVTKHDMPGFGLTQRPRDIDGYSLEANGRLGRLVMDAELAAAEVIKHSRDIAGLVLVAPAITSFSSQLKAQPDPDRQQNDAPMHGRILQVLMAFAQAVGTRTAGIVLWLLQPILVLFLRTLVRSRLFWVRGLSNAWHSRDGVSDELVDAYRLPQLVKGWEIGLVRFVRAQVADSRTFVQVLKDAYNGRTPLSQAEQLAHAVAQQDIKVLILHGSGDRLVPVSNSRRLAKLMPNAELIEYVDCGHVPQEELPKQFIQSVKTFVDQC